MSFAVMQPHDQKESSNRVFYGILNTAVVNAYVFYNENKP